jgi:hypothetical protein
MISDLMSTRSRCHRGLEYLVPVLDSVLKGSESPFGEQCHVSADYVLNVVKHKSKKDKKKNAVSSVIFALRLCVDFNGLCA